MKRISVTVALLFLLGAGVAQADRWVPRKRLPKPVDYPVVREKVKEHHKPGKKQNHPPSPVGSLMGLPVSTANA